MGDSPNNKRPVVRAIPVYPQKSSAQKKPRHALRENGQSVYQGNSYANTQRSQGSQRTSGNLRYSSPSQTSNTPVAKKGISRFLLPFFIVCFCVSLIAIGVILWGYFQGNRMYNDIASQATPTLNAAEDSLLDTQIDWEALYAINPETIAWVYVPGTEINYPIVQTSNNSKYLKTDFQGETNWVVSYGAIFLDSNCQADLSDQNSFFYGHNMNNGAMFAVLAQFADSDVFNEHRTVYLFTPEANYRLESFALLHVPANDALVEPVTGDSAAQQAYVQKQIDRSEVQPSGGFPDAASIDHTYVFVTCDNLPSDGRYALYCRMVDSHTV